MSSDDDYFDKQLKLVILGEPSTGKTALISRFCNNDYSRQYYPTYGVDFLHVRHLIRTGKEVSLVIWDVSGQALNSTMFPNYVYSANIILLVFDITNNASFTKMYDWFRIIKNTQTDSNPTIALIANKCDMEHQRSVSSEKQARFANDNGISSHTVSARTGENVVTAIQKVCADVLGLKLSRLEQEANQTVVKAEIVTQNQNQIYASYQSTPSSICSLQ